MPTQNASSPREIANLAWALAVLEEPKEMLEPLADLFLSQDVQGFKDQVSTSRLRLLRCCKCRLTS